MFLQAQQDSETQSSHLAEPEMPPKAASGQTAQSTPVQPPPGFSPNHLFGDADEEPMDFAASLSFLDETEQVDLYSLIGNEHFGLSKQHDSIVWVHKFSLPQQRDHQNGRASSA